MFFILPWNFILSFYSRKLESGFFPKIMCFSLKACRSLQLQNSIYCLLMLIYILQLCYFVDKMHWTAGDNFYGMIILFICVVSLSCLTSNIFTSVFSCICFPLFWMNDWVTQLLSHMFWYILHVFQLCIFTFMNLIYGLCCLLLRTVVPNCKSH